MTQLTKEAFEQAFEKLAKKETLDKLASTVDRTAVLVAGLVEDSHELKDDMKSVKNTLDQHTNILDGITKNTETWKAESAALRSAQQRHERWIKQLAAKIGIKLEQEQ